MGTRRRAAFETMAFLFSEAFSNPCTLLLPKASAGRSLTGLQIVLLSSNLNWKQKNGGSCLKQTEQAERGTTQQSDLTFGSDVKAVYQM